MPLLVHVAFASDEIGRVILMRLLQVVCPSGLACQRSAKVSGYTIRVPVSRGAVGAIRRPGSSHWHEDDRPASCGYSSIRPDIERFIRCARTYCHYCESSKMAFEGHIVFAVDVNIGCPRPSICGRVSKVS